MLADDPALTCRIPGWRQRPVVRVVLDTRLRTPLGSQLVRTARVAPTWLMHGPDALAVRRAMLTEAGVMLMEVPAGAGGLDMTGVLQVLGEAGLTRVLAEGGAGMSGGLLRSRLADQLAWFHAPAVMGADGLAASAAYGVAALAEMARFVLERVDRLGSDVGSYYRRSGSS